MQPLGLPFLLPAGVTLQHARLYHALYEAACNVILRPEQRTAFLGLGAGWGIDLRAGVAPVLPQCEVEHTTPRVRVGKHDRAYIFPHALVRQLKESWADERRMRVSFRGLLTPQRADLLKNWKGQEGVCITATDRGRRAETKYDDPGYAHELGSSQFVLCPGGDCAWSYRVVESVCAGAVPIVETAHPSYGDLVTLRMDEVTPDTLPDWRADLAEHNFEIARKLVTVPVPELLAEVVRLRGPR